MTRPIRVLELRSVWGTGGGPDKTILAGARLSNPAQFAITVCYIRDARDTVFTIDQRARALGLDYVEILERHSFDWRVWPALKRLVRERRIDIVHAHDHKTDALTWALARVAPIVPLSTAETQALYVSELNDRLNVLELLSNDRPLAPAESELARNSIRSLNSCTDAEKSVLLQTIEQRTVTTNQR